MDDLIERKKVLEILRIIGHGRPISGKRAISLISEMPSASMWIPCSERLPEKHVEVLAYSPYWGKIVVAMWGGEFWLEQWTDDDLEQSEITHWMPLPEPPEKE